MLKLINRVLIQESKLIEAYDARANRYYQRRWDERRKEMLSAGFDPDDIVNAVKPNTSSVNKAEKLFAKYMAEKDQKKAAEVDATSLIDQIDEYVIKLEEMGYEEQVEHINQLYIKKFKDLNERNRAMLEAFKELHKMAQEGADNLEISLWEKSIEGKEFKSKYPEDEIEGIAGDDISDTLESEPEEPVKDHKVRRFAHIVKKIKNDTDMSYQEMLAFLDNIGIDKYLVSKIFGYNNSLDYDRAALARAKKRIKALKPETAAKLRKYLENTLESDNYRSTPDDYRMESVKLEEDLIMLTESGPEMIPAGTKLFIVKS
jgi:hypothetical protein